VVAIALPALLMALYQQIDSTAYLRDKSLARLVASNKLEELRILARSSNQVFSGKDSGASEMGDREWYWWLEGKETQVPGFVRLDISVAAAEDQQDAPLYTLVGFMNADLQGAAGE
jgi:general secretion pathway protein I